MAEIGCFPMEFVAKVCTNGCRFVISGWGSFLAGNGGRGSFLLGVERERRKISDALGEKRLPPVFFLVGKPPPGTSQGDPDLPLFFDRGVDLAGGHFRRKNSLAHKKNLPLPQLMALSKTKWGRDYTKTYNHIAASNQRIFRSPCSLSLAIPV